jgi:hypothetical protein
MCDLWEFMLNEVLHDSEPVALDNLPVDTGVGECSARVAVFCCHLCSRRHSPPAFTLVSLPRIACVAVVSLVAVSVSSWRCSGVLAGMGTGTNTSTYNITGFGTGDVVLGATSPPGARLFNTLWQEFCEFRLRPTSGAELVRVGVGRGGDGDGEGRGGEGRGGEGVRAVLRLFIAAVHPATADCSCVAGVAAGLHGQLHNVAAVRSGFGAHSSVVHAAVPGERANRRALYHRPLFDAVLLCCRRLSARFDAK